MDHPGENGQNYKFFVFAEKVSLVMGVLRPKYLGV